MRVSRLIGATFALLLGATAVPADAQTPEVQNARVEKARLAGDILTVDLVIELRTATKLNNMVLVQAANAGSKYWASTHDLSAAASEATPTVRCTVTIPKFKRPKQSTTALGVMVGGGGGIVFDAGQTGRELDLKKGSPMALSNRLEVSFSLSADGSAGAGEWATVRADEPDMDLTQQIGQRLTKLKRNPLAIFARVSGKGGAEVEDGNQLRWNGATVVYMAEVGIGWCRGCSVNVKDGDVLYNVGPSQLKLGDVELKKGDLAVFRSSTFKLTTLQELEGK